MEETGNVRAVVLGTAQDGGIPHMGCDCSNCRRAQTLPAFRRKISSLAVWDERKKKIFIFDASPDIREQWAFLRDRSGFYEKKTRSVPDAVFLTHAHIGHYTGLMFFGYEALNTDNVPVYASSRMTDFLKKNGPWSQLVAYHNIEPRILPMDEAIVLTDNVRVESFPVPHREEFSDTLGFRISGPTKSLLFIPDIQKWERWTRSIVREVAAADYALLDGTFYSPEELPGRDISAIGHPLITESMDVLKNDAEKVFFTHLNHTNPALDPKGPAAAAMNKRGFHLAFDEQEFVL